MTWVHEVSVNRTTVGYGGAFSHTQSYSTVHTPFGSYQRYSETFHDDMFHRFGGYGRRFRNGWERFGEFLGKAFTLGAIGYGLSKLFKKIF